MAGKSEADDQAKKLSQLVNNIGSRIKVGGPPYNKACYLLATLIPDNLKSALNGSNSIIRIYDSVLRGRAGDIAILRYVLKEIGFTPESLLDELMKFIPEEYVIPEEKLPKLHLRRLILKVVAAYDANEAEKLISSVGSNMNPPVLLQDLIPNPAVVHDYTQPLIKFFEKAEQQLLVKPSDLSELRSWVEDAGYLDVVEKYHLDQPLEIEEITIPSGSTPPPYHRECPPPYLGERTRGDSIEEKRKPGKGEYGHELVNSTGHGMEKL